MAVAVSQSFENQNGLYRLLFGVVLLAHVPLCGVYCSWLWMFDHYRFFPLLFAVVGVLVWRRSDGSLTDCGRLRSQISWTLLTLSLICLAVATAAVSPWISWLAFVLACGSFLIRLTDQQTGGSLLYLWIPIWLTLRLPLNHDLDAIHWLQSFTSIVSGRFLDACGCVHLMSGNVLELPGRTLLVEEACSGVQSLFTMLFLAAIFSAIERRGLLRTFGLLVAAVFWTLFLNVVRVFTIAMALTKFNIDLSSGWMHECLGFGVLILSFLMLLSTDRLLFFFLRSIPDAGKDYVLINPFVSMTNKLVALGGGHLTSSAGGILPATGHANRNAKTKRRLPGFKIAAGTCLAAFVSVGCFQGLIVFGSPAASATNATDVVRLREADLADLGTDWHTTDFQSETRGTGSQWGPYSDTWSVQSSQRLYAVDFSYPFSGWHDLTVCYVGIGWQVASRQVIDGDWPYVVAMLNKSGGETGCVVFSAFRHEGEAVDPGLRLAGGLSDRARRAAFTWQQTLNPKSNSTYQAQVHFSADEPISEEMVQRAVDLHLTSRKQLRDRFVGLNGGAK
ncbi:exosortase U [bacterium]|nr:exosortase U [bacterium]